MTTLFRFTYRILLLVPVFSVCATEPVAMRGPDRNADTFSEVELDRALTALTAFRNFRYSGDYSFKFDLRHLPRRGREIVYSGQLWGTGDVEGTRTRFLVEMLETARPSARGFLVLNGPNPKAWSTSPDIGGPGLQPLHGESLFAPIFEGLIYTPFDLQMPFIFWERFEYEGETRRKGRQVFVFLMYPPEDSIGSEEKIGAVRIFLDHKFNALIRAEILDPNGKLTKTFKIVAFKKVQKRWILKTVDLVDEVRRDKTRFSVVAAAFNQKFDPRIFEADAIDVSDGAVVEYDAFEFF